jgi:hypothetical protein
VSIQPPPEEGSGVREPLRPLPPVRTVLDCGLFHTFDADERPGYVASLTSVTQHDGTLYVLCFSDMVPIRARTRSVRTSRERRASAPVLNHGLARAPMLGIARNAIHRPVSVRIIHDIGTRR